MISGIGLLAVKDFDGKGVVRLVDDIRQLINIAVAKPDFPINMQWIFQQFMLSNYFGRYP